MPTDHRAALKEIHSFPSLVCYGGKVLRIDEGQGRVSFRLRRSG